MKIINKDDIKNVNKINTRLNNIISKEDLEIYYIDEGKSLAEISRIYGCSNNTIKNKLKKYKIFIRPYGAFLVDDDGESLSSKCNKGEIGSGDYRNELVKNRGYKNAIDYRNELVKNRGYKNWSDYISKMRYEKGIGTGLSMSENKECSLYLGVYIAERILPLLFENVERMPDGNPGFDFICNNGYKIDVKSSSLSDNNTWSFVTDKNKTADYFFMIAFDDRENLGVMHIWLVKGDAVIEKTNHYLSEEFIINEKDIVNISKGNKSLKRWIKYEKADLLEKAQKLCDSFKEKNECEINKGDSDEM